jgi:CRISPR-associated exonuclease Cas4
MSKPLITASQVARHSFCARALAYDQFFGLPGQTAGWQALWLWLGPPLFLAVLLGLVLYVAVLDDLLISLSSVVLGLLLFAGLRWVWGRWQRGNQVIIYHNQPAKPFRDFLQALDFGLSGQPPYIIPLAEGGAIPLLLKQNPAPPQAHEAHILQVIAYCLLLAEKTGQHPPFGVIRYGDRRTFEVDFDEDAVEYLARTMDEIEANRRRTEVPISHQDPL